MLHYEKCIQLMEISVKKYLFFIHFFISLEYPVKKYNVFHKYSLIGKFPLHFFLSCLSLNKFWELVCNNHVMRQVLVFSIASKLLSKRTSTIHRHKKNFLNDVYTSKIFSMHACRKNVDVELRQTWQVFGLSGSFHSLKDKCNV